MSKRAFSTCVTFVAAAALSACAGTTTPFSEDDAAAVRENLAAYIRADPTSEPDAFFAAFTDDVHWIYSDNEPWVGQQGLRDVDWCGTNQAEINPDRIEGSADVAYARGTYTLSLDCGGTAPVEGDGVFISAHRRQPDGTWRIESLRQTPRSASGGDVAATVEGAFEYVGAVRGQSILTDGRYVFLYGPSDGSAPMTAHAGTYEISGDTVTHAIRYATDPSIVGSAVVWTPESVTGDTLNFYVVGGSSPGPGAAVRVD